MKFVFPMLIICRRAIGTGLLFLVAVVLTSACLMACSSRSEASPFETDERNAARLMRGLPPGGVVYTFAEIEKVMRRPAMRQEVEQGFEELSEKSRGLIGSGLLAEGDVKSLAFAIASDGTSGATILSGDFEGLQKALREVPSLAESSSRFDPPRSIDPYRGLELIVFPWHHDLFIAVPDSETLLLADSVGLLNEVIDRHLDGGDLHPRLTGLLGNVKRVDFLVAFVLGAGPAGQGEDSSPPAPVFLAHAGHLNEGGTSTVYAYLEFAEDGHAEEALELQSSRPDLGDLFFGYKRDTVTPTGDLWREGRALIARAVVPDEAVADLFLTN